MVEVLANDILAELVLRECRSQLSGVTEHDIGHEIGDRLGPITGGYLSDRYAGRTGLLRRTRRSDGPRCRSRRCRCRWCRGRDSGCRTGDRREGRRRLRRRRYFRFVGGYVGDLHVIDHITVERPARGAEADRNDDAQHD